MLTFISVLLNHAYLRQNMTKYADEWIRCFYMMPTYFYIWLNMLVPEYSVVMPAYCHVHPQIKVLGSMFLGSGKGSGPTLMIPACRCGRTGGETW